MTRNYENEINNLTHEKSRLLEEVDKLNSENSAIKIELNESVHVFETKKIQLDNYIISLKEELEAK